jgi:predicted nicotinamide N-methyase
MKHRMTLLAWSKPSLDHKVLQTVVPQTLQDNLRQSVSAGNLQITSLPLCPEVSLYLLSGDYPRGRLDYDEMMTIMNNPAYWAFCWASGQVLARYILDNPGEVRNKRVLDFGSGSGVVAVAAKMAGAHQVIACDIDPHALLACKVNAELNQVSIELLDDVNKLSHKMSLIIAADVLYDRDNYPWIDKLPLLADDVLIADSRVKTEELAGYGIVNRITATTIPDLDESAEFSHVRVHRKNPPDPLSTPSQKLSEA